MRRVNRKGYTMTVEFFSRDDAGNTISEGRLTLHKGTLVATPAGALKGVLAHEVRVMRDPDPPLILRATDDPAAFLAALPKQYHGSRFWAKQIED